MGFLFCSCFEIKVYLFICVSINWNYQDLGKSTMGSQVGQPHRHMYFITLVQVGFLLRLPPVSPILQVILLFLFLCFFFFFCMFCLRRSYIYVCVCGCYVWFSVVCENDIVQLQLYAQFFYVQLTKFDVGLWWIIDIIVINTKRNKFYIIQTMVLRYCGLLLKFQKGLQLCDLFGNLRLQCKFMLDLVGI